MNQNFQQPQPKLFVTTDEILNATLQYLGSRPYADVAHLIDALRQSKPFVEPETNKSPVGEKPEEAPAVKKEKVIDMPVVDAKVVDAGEVLKD